MIQPKSLQPNDPVALITPAHQITAHHLATAIEHVTDLGLTVAYAPSVRSYGYFAGTVAERVAELNQLFADPAIKAIMTIRGGSGTASLLPHLDYLTLKKYPKIIMGLSDVTALLSAVTLHSKIVTLHGPVARSVWPDYTLRYVRAALFDSNLPLLQNPDNCPVTTINPGRVTGMLWGGNLSVLCALLGTRYVPEDWRGTILFLEDTHEAFYRIDRMLTHLMLAGVLEQVAGIVLGQFTHCSARTLGTFHLMDVFRRHFEPLGVPTYCGAMFGHEPLQFVLPIGREAQLDADRGVVRVL